MITTGGVVFLTVAGGVVRLTDSGLGCADWPACNEERFIDVSSTHAAIEQLNRLASGLIGIPTLLLLIGGFLVKDRAGLRWPAVATFVSVVVNGIVGGIAVRTDLHPAIVQSHFLLAMVAVVFGMIAILRSGTRPLQSAVERGRIPTLALVVTTLTAAALATGTVVTGTGPHAGDEEARRFGFDISHVARIHGITVILTLSAALWLAWRLTRSADRPAGQHRLVPVLSAWLFLGFLQGAIGYAQYFNGVPEILVGIHIALAAATWVVTMRLVVLALTPPTGAEDRGGATDRGGVDDADVKHEVLGADSAHV